MMMNRPRGITRRDFLQSAAIAAAATGCATSHPGGNPLIPAEKEPATMNPESKNRLQWWQEARFGMFIHWGLYSLLGRGEWVFYQEHFGPEEYAKLADRFHPQHFRPKEWVAMAQDAGMRYMVITTRHHDGFCLYDSKVSDFTAPKTAAKRDFIAEFADACRTMGMRVGFYYSLMDWRFPGAIPHSVIQPDEVYLSEVEQAHAQVREICTQYGTVDILWYDMMHPHKADLWRSEELNRMVRELQPDIIINDRAGLPEDFGTPENVIRVDARPWEACYTMNRTWGYAKYDRNYKPPHEIIRLLTTCVDGGGNLLLNVGPDGEGEFPIESVETLRHVGRWMRANGKAIYGAGPSPISAPALGLASRVGDRVYLLIQRWPGSPVAFAWCGSKVASARVLSTGQEATIEQKGDRVWLRGLPDYPPDPYMNVIELEFDGEPRASDPAYA
ncbi:MAG TPA: alpha-L-fucosidase [bacterium]|nr:alpha-L-fucosidase [bacterium]HQO35449.1 alpha-L-fucosidase [bacterium]